MKGAARQELWPSVEGCSQSTVTCLWEGAGGINALTFSSALWSPAISPLGQIQREVRGLGSTLGQTAEPRKRARRGHSGSGRQMKDAQHSYTAG